MFPNTHTHTAHTCLQPFINPKPQSHTHTQISNNTVTYLFYIGFISKSLRICNIFVQKLFLVCFIYFCVFFFFLCIRQKYFFIFCIVYLIISFFCLFFKQLFFTLINIFCFYNKIIKLLFLFVLIIFFYYKFIKEGNIQY